MADQPPPAKRARRMDGATTSPRSGPPVSERERGGNSSGASHRDDGRNGYGSAGRRRSRSRSPHGHRDRDRKRAEGNKQRERSRSPAAKHRDRTFRDRDRDRDPEPERGGRDHTSRRDRSRSRERKQGRDRERDSGSYRSSKDPKVESRKRSRSRSRSRSPSRTTTNVTSSSAAHPRARVKQEDRNEIKPIRPTANGNTSASSRKLPSNASKAGATKEDDMDIESDDADALLKKMMGFSTFKTTQNTKVPGNQIYGVRREKKTEYRQYMNRVGGFNRPLSPGR